jgi:hypothetical protein
MFNKFHAQAGVPPGMVPEIPLNSKETEFGTQFFKRRVHHRSHFALFCNQKILV